MGLVLTTPPASEPVTLAEAKAQCRVELAFTDDDAILTTFIAVARRAAEKHTGVGIIPQRWTLTLAQFPPWSGHIELPKGPVISIDSVTYLDTNGATQTLDPATYVWVRDELADRLSLAYNKVWPVTYGQANAVTIAFTIGFVVDITAIPLVAAVPDDLKAAMLLMIGDLYRNRESQIIAGTVAPNGTAALLLDGFVRELVV